jgi:hypothetical protein
VGLFILLTNTVFYSDVGVFFYLKARILVLIPERLIKVKKYPSKTLEVNIIVIACNLSEYCQLNSLRSICLWK